MKHLLRRFTFFKRAQEGVAYLEFAICLPFLLALLMGAVEITRYILIAQKLEKVAFTLADVTSQGQTITTAQLDRIVTAASQVMQPYTFSANAYVIITSVTQTGAYTGSNPAIIKWQYKGGGTWTQT